MPLTSTSSTPKRDTEDYYKGDRGRLYHQTKREVPKEAFFWVSRLRAKKIQGYITEEDTALEYGVGYGWNLASITCRRRIGFDVSDFLEKAVTSQKIEFFADSKKLPEGVADIIICHHVLEHIYKPTDALKEMHRLLRPNGKLLIFVPYCLSNRFNVSDKDHHIYSWDVQTLGNLIVECGFIFKSGRTGKFGYDRFSAQLATRLRIGEYGYQMVRNLLHFVRPRKEVRIVATKPQ